MSWNVRAVGVSPNSKDIDNLEKLAIESAKAANPDGEDQAQLAARVVNDILGAGVIGNTTKKYTVSISGHANPDHEPKSGWSNDMISIQISQES